MKRTTGLNIQASTALAFLLAAGQSWADDDEFNFRLKVSKAINSEWSFIDDQGGTLNHGSADITPISASATVFIDDMYLEVEKTASSGSPMKFVNGNLDRDTVSAKVGVGNLDGVSFFTAYQKTTTSFNNALATVFDNQGIMLGLNMNVPYGKSIFNFNSAVGFISGSWTDNATGTDKSDSTFGYELGVGYSYQITSNVSVGADFKWQFFSYDFTNGLGYSIDEDVKGYGINAAFRF